MQSFPIVTTFFELKTKNLQSGSQLKSSPIVRLTSLAGK